MASRHRVQSAEIRFGPALKALGACLLIACAAVGYVRQKHELTLLYERGARLQADLVRIRLQNAAYERRLNQLENPDSLALAIQRRLVGLGPTRPGQVVTLPMVHGADEVGDDHLALAQAGEVGR